MNCRFYNFSKRKNSTAVPADAGTLFNVLLKEPTSEQNPVLKLQADTFEFNYARIFNTYYFVADITHVRNDLYQVTLEKDVLGTYRSQIRATNAYVMYDSAGNSEIVDSRLAIKTSKTVSEESKAFPNITAGNGAYVVSCVGEDSSVSWLLDGGSTPNGLVTSIYFNDINNAMDVPEPSWSFDIAQNISDGFKWLCSLFKAGASQTLASGNALESIRNCIWLPFVSADLQPKVAGYRGQIKLGKYQTGITATAIRNPVVQLDQVVVPIPWQFSDWRRNNPYTQIYLYIPFIGVIQLPAGQLVGVEAISVKVALNVISGDLSVNVLQGYQVLGSYGANVSMPYPIGASNLTPRQMFNSIMAAAAGVATAGVASVAVGAAALSGVASITAANLTGIPTCVGGLSNGSASGLSTNIICFTVNHDTTINPASVADVIGLPSFQKKTLSSVSGYVQCHEFSLNAAAPSSDLDAVNKYLNTGAFIE